MTFNYVASRATADRLLANFGQSVSLRRTSSSGTAWEPTQTTTDYATTAAIFDYTARQIDGENVLVTDRRAFVAAGPLTAAGIISIAPPDAFVIGSAVVPVVRAVALSPAGTVVIYDCQLRF